MTCIELKVDGAGQIPGLRHGKRRRRRRPPAPLVFHPNVLPGEQVDLVMETTGTWKSSLFWYTVYVRGAVTARR